MITFQNVSVINNYLKRKYKLPGTNRYYSNCNYICYLQNKNKKFLKSF